MSKLYYKQSELQLKFGIGSTYCTRICRAIDNHEQIYTKYARLGTMYSVCAFTHARKYLKELENDLTVPEYNPDEIKKAIDESEYKAEKKNVEDRLRSMMIAGILDWFKVTKIPKDMSVKEYSKIVRNAMLSIVAE